MSDQRSKAVQSALDSIHRQFGKEADYMRMGDKPIEPIPLGLDIALGIGGFNGLSRTGYWARLWYEGSGKKKVLKNGRLLEIASSGQSQVVSHQSQRVSRIDIALGIGGVVGSENCMVLNRAVNRHFVYRW